MLFFVESHEIFTVVYSTHFYEFKNSLGILNTTKIIKNYEIEAKIFSIFMLLYCIMKKSKKNSFQIYDRYEKCLYQS